MEDEWTSATGDVYAIIAISPDALTIEEWSSCASGCGNSRRALQALRDEYPGRTIVAQGIGSDPSDASWTFWRHMHARDLVDVLLDDELSDVTPSGARAAL